MAETSTAQQMLDQEMIARIGRRDQSAFSALYDRLSGPLYSLAMKMLGDPAEAQDALQDVFLQIWSRAGSYNPEQSSVFSWTVLLTRSRVIDRWACIPSNSDFKVPNETYHTRNFMIVEFNNANDQEEISQTEKSKS